MSKEFSVNKTNNEIKSEGIKTSKDTLYKFTKYLVDIFLLFYVSKYDVSVKKQEINTKKVYCIDNGLINAISFKFSKDKGRLLENIVFLNLRRLENEIFYHKNKFECDFLIKKEDKITQAIQVCFDLGDESTKEREIKGLTEAMNEHKLKKGILLNYDEEYEINFKSKTIYIIPVWKWLLEY